MLLKFFIEKNCDPSSKTLFIAESPNEKTESLILNKLKLAEKVVFINLM